VQNNYQSVMYEFLTPTDTFAANKSIETSHHEKSSRRQNSVGAGRHLESVLEKLVMYRIMRRLKDIKEII